MIETEPEVRRGRSISPIWIIPAVALALGLWMVVHTFLSEGPTIEIYLQTAQGLEAGKTKIKYRNVTVGVVQQVALSDDLQQVVASAKLERQVADMLRQDTRFWVVTARVGAGSVSGLETVLSGAYIEMAPGEGSTGEREFTALEVPPTTPAGTSGMRLRLFSDRAASVGTGDPVLYRGYKVGRVESNQLDPDSRQMLYQVFIDAPFHALVDSSVRFWDVSGLSLSAGADGIDFRMASLTTLLAGGIAFGTPKGLPAGREVKDDAEFELYRSQEDTLSDPYRNGKFYVVAFTQSLRGLNPGAPVEYRGIPIGRVERIMLLEVAKNPAQHGELGRPLQVLLHIEPGRFEMPDTLESVEQLGTDIELGILAGLRASLATGNLVTGGKYISLDYYPTEEPAVQGEYAGLPTIPAVSSGLEHAEQKLFALLDKFNQLPLEGTIEKASRALSDFSLTMESLRKVMDPQVLASLLASLEITLSDLQRTLAGLSPDSQLYQNLNTNLAGLDRTIKNLESLTATLAERPNALVVGADRPADPVPEARK